MDEKNQVFINLSGEDAKQMGFLLRQASQSYNNLDYSKWLHTLSSIHERIFHRIQEDDETLDSLYGECAKLQKYWNKYIECKQEGKEVPKDVYTPKNEYIASVRNYSRALMLELNNQGYFPNRKAMSETRLE